MACIKTSKEFMDHTDMDEGGGYRVVPTTSGAAVTIHTAPASQSKYDELWLYAHNQHTTSASLTVEIGTGSGKEITMSIGPDDGLYLVLPGITIRNSTVVKVYASVASVISVFGFVNRIDYT